jgi:small subunit ribosomal protein S20
MVAVQPDLANPDLALTFAILFTNIMANHKSAEKRNRANEKKRVRNRYQHKTTRTLVKKLGATTKKDEAAELYKEVSSMLDKLAKKNIIHWKKAANQKSKLAKRINAIA